LTPLASSHCQQQRKKSVGKEGSEEQGVEDPFLACDEETGLNKMPKISHLNYK